MPKSFCENCTEILREYLPMPGDYEVEETPKENYESEHEFEIGYGPKYEKCEETPRRSSKKRSEIPKESSSGFNVNYKYKKRRQGTKSTRSYENPYSDPSFDLHQRIEAHERELANETETETPKELSDYILEIETEIDPETEPSVIPEYDLNLEPNYEPLYETEYEIEPEFDIDSDIEVDSDADQDTDASPDIDYNY